MHLVAQTHLRAPGGGADHARFLCAAAHHPHSTTFIAHWKSHCKCASQANRILFHKQSTDALNNRGRGTRHPVSMPPGQKKKLTFMNTTRSRSRSNLCAYCPCLQPFCLRPGAYGSFILSFTCNNHCCSGIQRVHPSPLPDRL